MPTPSGTPTAPDPDKFFETLDDTPKPAEATLTPAEKVDPKTTPKPGEKPAAKTEPAPKPAAGEQGEQFKTPKELRQAYDKTTKELTAKNAEVVRLLQQLETAKSSAAPAAEVAALSERLAKRDQEYQTLESELKLLRYERSPEYKQKFEEPYNQAYKRAVQSINGLTVKMKNAETGEVTERPATEKDFAEVLGQPTEGAAYRVARELFGDDHQLVTRHVDRLFEIAEQSKNEITKYRQQATERDSNETARQATERQASEAMARRADEGWKQRNKWFSPIEGDEEGNALLQKGFQQANMDEKALTPDQRAIYHSYRKHAVAALPRLQAKVTAYETRIADLETKLQEFEESGPGPGKTTPGPKAPTGEAPDAMSDPNAPWNKP
jgi:hypothetical protein